MPPTNVPTTDAEMNAAIARARATLPAFWASYEAQKPSEAHHNLKVRFWAPRNDGLGHPLSEHIWISDVKRLANGSYSGRINSVPLNLPGKRDGDLVEFEDADISDWLFTRSGKIVGGETIKYLMKTMPKTDADALRARMETPMSNSYRLGVHPASYYASLFDASIDGERRWHELGVATIGQGDLEFEIRVEMPTEEECVPERFVSMARSVLSHVVEMDDAARADPRCGPIDEDEVLAYVMIRDAYVEFHYYSTRVNTEWDVYFTPNVQGGWDYRGFQPP